MPLKVPTLDDRTYADLVREGIELIPRYAPAWTNHNASDPGITLLELFAYVTEIQLYRVDRITDASRARFLKLLLGGDGDAAGVTDLHQRLEDALLEVRQAGRAVTADDFERLALEAAGNGPGNARVARAECFPCRNLDDATVEGRQRNRPGHISLVFVPSDPWLAEEAVQALGEGIRRHVEPRRLLATRVHVLAPRYVDATFGIRVAPLPGYRPGDVRHHVGAMLNRFFDPQRGGPRRSGWRLGEDVLAADVSRHLETTEGVARVTALDFDVSERERVRRAGMGRIVGIRLRTGELLRARAERIVCDE